MSWRTVIVSNQAKLEVQSGFMLVRTGDDTQRIVLDEIALVIVENTAVSLTAYLLAELVDRKVRVIFCDCARNPLAELQPYHGCHDVTRKLRMQLAWSSATKAHIWERIVLEKIHNQAQLLRRHNQSERANLLESYEVSLEPGDATNREGHAAKVYFAGLFGDDFKRSSYSHINSALDYGYMMLLAVFNRALTSEGLLTPLGLAHGSVFNQWNLSCDLIEPFRPWIDHRVVELSRQKGFTFDREVKRNLVRYLHDSCRIDGKQCSIMNTVTFYIRSVIRALEKDAPQEIIFPEL